MEQLYVVNYHFEVGILGVASVNKEYKPSWMKTMHTKKHCKSNQKSD